VLPLSYPPQILGVADDEFEICSERSGEAKRLFILQFAIQKESSISITYLKNGLYTNYTVS